MRRHYFANITLIDDWVGRIVEAIEKTGELDNTLFVFTSDHGLVYKFSSHYDAVARVPLIFAGPGVSSIGERDQLVELIDLGPTLLDLAGLGPLDGASGISIRPLLEGEDTELHETVFSEHGPRIMARTRKWKLIFYPGEPYGELYNLTNDPDELHNLYDSPECELARSSMVERMLHWMATTQQESL